MEEVKRKKEGKKLIWQVLNSCRILYQGKKRIQEGEREDTTYQLFC
jgi:hypothetical protein